MCHGNVPQQAAAKEQAFSLKKALDTSTQMIARLEADLEARSAALEASVAATAGLGATKPTAGSSGVMGPSGSGASTPLDLAALLGVQDAVGVDGKDRTRKAGAGTSPPTGAGAVNSQINVQMINILQSQRDQYKEKLTRVRALL